MKKFTIAAALAVAVGTGAAQGATFSAEFWDASTSFSTVADAIAFAQSHTSTATFASTGIDYPAGSGSISDATSLAAFLGVDGASLVGTNVTDLSTSVFHFTGLIDLAAGEHSFSVGSDDGFVLSLNGAQLSSYSAPRGFSYTTVSSNAYSGLVSIDLWYYENYGNTGVEFNVDGSVAQPADVSPVPVPASGLLLAGALGAAGIARRRKKA